MNKFAVICKDDDGFYVLATRQYWDKWEDAFDWSRAIASTRLAIIVEGAFHQMRPVDAHVLSASDRIERLNEARARLKHYREQQAAAVVSQAGGGASLSAPAAREE